MLEEIRDYFDGGGRVIEGEMLDRFKVWHLEEFGVEQAVCIRVNLVSDGAGGINFDYDLGVLV